MELNYFQFDTYSPKVRQDYASSQLEVVTLHSLKDLGKDKTKVGIKAWVAPNPSFSDVCVCVCVLLSHVWFSVTPWSIAHHAPLSMAFSRQEYWSGLPFPSPGDLPDLGLLHWRQIFFSSEPPRNPILCSVLPKNNYSHFSSNIWSQGWEVSKKSRVLIPCRALWGSWAQGLHVSHSFHYRKQPLFSLRELLWVSVGRFKQLLITEGRGFEIMKKQSILFLYQQIHRQHSVQVSSVTQVVSDSLWPHGPQHTRPPCSSSAPGVYPSSCPLSQWCHPTISSSVVPFSCPQSFPASWSFLRSQLFTSGGQVLEVKLQQQSFQWTLRIDLL